MSVWRATLRRDWIVHREFLLDYAVAAVVMAAVFPGDNPYGFAIVGALFASALAVRLGGDETRQGTWEFVLTRPIARPRWLKLRFHAGALTLGVLLLFFVLADAIGLHLRFAGLLAEPLGAVVDTGGSRFGYCTAAAMVWFTYTVTYSLALRERRPDRVTDQRVHGLVLGGGLGLFAVELIALYVRQGVAHRDSVPFCLPIGMEPLAVVAILGSLALLVYRHMERDLLRREVANQPGLVAAPHSVGPLMVLIVVAVIVVLVCLWLLPARVVPSR